MIEQDDVPIATTLSAARLIDSQSRSAGTSSRSIMAFAPDSAAAQDTPPANGAGPVKTKPPICGADGRFVASDSMGAHRLRLNLQMAEPSDDHQPEIFSPGADRSAESGAACAG